MLSHKKLIEDTKLDNESFQNKVDDLIESFANIDQFEKSDIQKCKGCNLNIGDNNNLNENDDDAYVEVGDDMYHSSCFICSHCKTRLLGEFYVIDEKYFCQLHKQVALGKCHLCGDFLDGNSVVVSGKSYHPTCFVCSECQAPLIGKFYTTDDQRWLCDNDWRLRQPRCSLCGLPILDRVLTALDKKYHPACFTCALCNVSLDGEQFVVDDKTQTVTCRQCYIRTKAPKCERCKSAIVSEPGKRTTVITCNGKQYHHNCYTCKKCDMNLSGKEVFLDEESEIICKDCSNSLN